MAAAGDGRDRAAGVMELLLNDQHIWVDSW
jgi:hypothetical protein